MWTRHVWANSHIAYRHALASGLLLVVCFAIEPSRAEMPASLPDSGPLLSAVAIGPGVEVGVYGPRFVTGNEPALLAVLIAGDAQSSIEHGFIIVSAPDETVDFSQAPAPSGAYLTKPHDTSLHAQWLPLLHVGTNALWTLRVLPMAHSRFRLGAGVVLDETVLSSHLPQPERGSAFRTVSDRSRKDYDSMCVAFVTDHRIASPSAIPSETSSDSEPLPAVHAIRLSLPVKFGRPDAVISFWIALSVNAQPIGQALTVSIGGNRPQGPVTTTSGDVPVLAGPSPHAMVSTSVNVVGQTRPGMLAVAWLQWSGQASEAAPSIARRITDREGRFSLRLPVPPLRTPAMTTIELHVRAESPGYQSEPVIVPLRIAPPQ